ncbi:MAG: hypothetical protein H0W02_21870 [Ktedonobacteraceae bacterium]|nr:hypothetical protein [Ktedonobacteraceae bacterium]
MPMHNPSPWTQRGEKERLLLDIAMVLSVLAGVMLVLFNGPFPWWLSIVAWWVAIILAITITIISQDSQPYWRLRQRIRGNLIIYLVGFGVFFLFKYLAAITHNDIFVWVGILAIPVVLLLLLFILRWIMKRQKKAREEKQSASDGLASHL